jgi:CheY-like chemotaxis protein/two-component sensor histidine kinase
LPDEAREYLGVLQGSGESLLDIVNDVLDLSKIEANRLELESEVFDVEALVQTATGAFKQQAAKKGLSLECTVTPAASAPSRGDSARLRQVINNLLGNALKFTHAGSVRVRVDREGETLFLQVADTGPGIPGDRRSAIFEPFVQGDGTTSRRFGGTGLGLTICRHLVQLMGGDITVDSELGVGSTFRVRVQIPRVVIDRAEPKRLPREHSVQPRPMRVLLAEDNAINARMTCAIVETLGHRVEVVSDGQQALEALQLSAYDLVLMDVQMPVVDGLEATRRIRSDAKSVYRHVPIVALTANALRGDDLICLYAGMDAYLAKPVTVDALKDMLVWFGERA